jgi:signal transduction histidine kinase
VARGLCLVLLVPGLALVAMAVERRRAMARLVAVGFGLMLVGAAHDILLAMGRLDGQPYLGTYAFLGFVLVQGYAVVRQSVHYARFARDTVGRLEDEIVERTRHLSDAVAATQAAHARQTHFLRTITHEVRTPLTSIIGYVDVLREELADTLDDAQRHFLRTIRESAQRITALINDLLDLQKVAAGHLDLHPGRVEADDVLAPVRDELHALAARKGLTLTTAVDEATPAVWADAVRLRQVLLNLGANAVKFTDAGTVTLRAAPSGPDAVRFTVEDTGPGIPADDLPHIFDQFTRAQSTGRLDAGLGAHGSGLGLSIAKELVTRMDGAIDVATTLGEGTTFIVTLPAADAGEAGDVPLPEVSVSATG